MCETQDGSSAPNHSRLAGALPLLVRAASRAANAAFPVRRHLCKSIPKSPARLKIRGRPRVRHPAVGVFVCRAGGPVAACPVECAALDAQCRCRHSSAENSSTVWKCRFSSGSRYGGYSGSRDDWWTWASRTKRRAPASSASATRSTTRATGCRRASPRPTRSQPPPPHRLHQPLMYSKRGLPKYAKRSPCVRLLEWNSAKASFLKYG